MVLTPYPHLQCLGFKKSRAIPLPTLRALVAYKGGTFTFTFMFVETINIFGYRIHKIIFFSYGEVANCSVCVFSFSVLCLGHVSNHFFLNMHFLIRKFIMILTENSGMKERVQFWSYWETYFKT